MVDLALLCNLYADGPTTLGRLRELGCENLADVERIERADLEWALQASAQNCERFRREARALRERVGARASAPRAASPRSTQATAAQPTSEDAARATAATNHSALDVSASARPASERGAAAAPDAERFEPSLTEQARAADDQTSTSARPAPSSSILGVLLQAWRRASGRGGDAPVRPRHESNDRRVPGPRESNASLSLSNVSRFVPPMRDERAEAASAPTPSSVSTTPAIDAAPPAPAAPSEPSVSFSAARSEVPTVELTPLEPKPVVRTTPAPSGERRAEHGTPLERIGFQGVEADYAEQLARLGVRTVEDFLAAQTLDLAGRSSMRYTVLLRMQFLARRELERVVRG